VIALLEDADIRCARPMPSDPARSLQPRRASERFRGGLLEPLEGWPRPPAGAILGRRAGEPRERRHSRVPGSNTVPRPGGGADNERQPAPRRERANEEATMSASLHVLPPAGGLADAPAGASEAAPAQVAHAGRIEQSHLRCAALGLSRIER